MSSVFLHRILKTDSVFVRGLSSAMQDLGKVVGDLAGTDIPILLIGESGTGKDAYARMFHSLSGLDGTALKKAGCTQDPNKALIQQPPSAPSTAQLETFPPDR